MGDREFPNAREAVEYFKGRIAERRDHERRQKIQDDLQLIRNRRNHEVIFPVPEGHDQEMWFKKLDSNGIWERVFEFVTSPSDVTSAYFACDMFKKHLEEKRKMMHLAKVFGILRDAGHVQYSMKSSCWCDCFICGLRGLAFVRPDVGSILPPEPTVEFNHDILNLRLVSKFWKNAAEEEFLLKPLGFSEPDWHLKCDNPMPSIYSYYDCVMRCTQIQCEFRSVEDVDNALEALLGSKSSRCLIRTLWVDDDIYCNDQATRETFHSKVVQFLDIHGDSVWGFKVLLMYTEYEFLCNMVSRMPHLKALVLVERNGLFDRGVTDAQIRGILAQTLFPTIPSLQFCKFPPFCRSVEPLIVEVLNRNPSIKTINLDFNFFWRGTDLFWNSLSNLRFEHINFGFGFAYDLIGPFVLRKLEESNWPIKVIRIWLADGSDAQIDLGRFLEVFSRFNLSMEIIRLTSHANTPFNADGACVVADFPNLKGIYLYPAFEN